jgi:plastocyanin
VIGLSLLLIAMNKRTVFLLIAAGLLVSGCAPKGCRQDRSSGLALAALPAPTFGEASVSGRVRFEGEPPVMAPIEAARHCADISEEWALVAEDGGLANVLVYLEGAPASSGKGREVVELDQENCRFVPRVVGVQIGQPLLAMNSDLEFHNVHYTPQNNDNTNFGLETYGKKRTVSFDQPEDSPISVKCDVHPWMQAYVGVFAHPFFAVTDAAGRYKIAQVPAGQYTLKAWHERFGIREETIHVADAGESVIDFTFARRGS